MSIYSRVTHEFFSATWPRRRWNLAVIQRAIIGWIFLESIFLLWARFEFDLLIQIAGFLTANLAVAGIAVAAFYLNHKLPPAYRTRPVVFVCALAATVVLVVASWMSAYGLVRKMWNEPPVAERTTRRVGTARDFAHIPTGALRVYGHSCWNPQSVEALKIDECSPPTFLSGSRPTSVSEGGRLWSHCSGDGARSRGCSSGRAQAPGVDDASLHVVHPLPSPAG